MNPTSLADLPDTAFSELSSRQRADLRVMVQDLARCHARIREFRQQLHREHTGLVGMADPPCTNLEVSISAFSADLSVVVHGLTLSGEMDRRIGGETTPLDRLGARSVHPDLRFEPASGLYSLSIDVPAPQGRSIRKTVVGIDVDAMALGLLADLDRLATS